MRNCIFFIFLALPNFHFPQDHLAKMKDDSLKVNQYQKIAKDYSETDSAKAFSYYRKSLELAQKLRWEKGISQSYLAIGDAYEKFYNYPKAMANYRLALQSKDKKIQAKAHFSIGEIYLEQSNFTKALTSHHQSLKLYETSNDKYGIVNVLLSIGSVYTSIGKNKEALNSYDRALKISNEANNFKQEIILRGIGTVYYNYGENEKSLDYLERSLAIIKQKKDKNLESRLLSDIALVYLELGQYQKAINYSQASLKTDASIINKIHNVAFSYGVIGDSYLEFAKERENNSKLLDSSILYLEKAVKLHKEFNSLRGLYDDYTSIYEAQKLKGNLSDALKSYEISIAYKDSMYNSDNKETIKNLEDKREIELRDREIKINKLRIEAKEKQKWLLVSGLIFLGIIGGLLLYQNRNRKKANQKLDEKNKALDEANKINARFFGILNHDLRSPVYNLIHFLHLQKENPELLDDEMKKSIQGKTMVSAENLLQSMEDMLQWSKSQMENFKPQPKEIYVSELFKAVENHFSSEENIKISFENPSNICLITDENYLKTIIRNLTGNAVKALKNTDNPTIIWKTWKENNRNFLSITDNGSGASQEQFKALYDEKEVVGIKSGLGLHLIRDLAKAIDCEIEVITQLNSGTTIILSLK